MGEVGVGAYAHATYLQRRGRPRTPQDLAAHTLIGFDRDDLILRGFARAGMPLRREHFALRTDDPVAYGELVRAGAGIGFLAHYVAARWDGVQRVLPELPVDALPCWLAVHREIRGSPVVRAVFDRLAAALPPRLAGGG